MDIIRVGVLRHVNMEDDRRRSICLLVNDSKRHPLMLSTCRPYLFCTELAGRQHLCQQMCIHHLASTGFGGLTIPPPVTQSTAAL